MEKLARTHQFGDITFGMPSDIKEVHKPWGFYEIIGVDRTASRDEIKKACKKLKMKLHTDRGGDEAKFKLVSSIEEKLTDTGGELGYEHSQRAHYDKVSELGEFFDGHIEVNGERTRSYAEAVLTKMEAERKYAEAEHEIEKEIPGIRELKKQAEAANSPQEAMRLTEQMWDMIAESQGISRQELDKRKEEFRRFQEAMHENQRKKVKEFGERFQTKKHDYLRKVLDIRFLEGDLKFGTDPAYLSISMVDHEVSDNILYMVLTGENCLYGWKQVHVKADKGSIRIQDPSLTGIFHVAEGYVHVDYESSSYGGVIRARADEVDNFRGFVQRGDLFVPEKFATENWWEREPTLDIAVNKGTIGLTLRSPRVYSDKYISTLHTNSLEDLLKGNSYRSIYSDIGDNFKRKLDDYIL